MNLSEFGSFYDIEERHPVFNELQNLLKENRGREAPLKSSSSTSSEVSLVHTPGEPYRCTTYIIHHGIDEE